MARYIFIAGGVMSGIGKGVTTSSVGRILESKGFKVAAIKIDPYVNVDAGTMNPIEHGEIFVTDDGTECDQDVGNYERFLDQNLESANYITTGRVYQAVIQKERNLEYEGKCVEVVPHIPEEVIRRIRNVQRKEKADFILIEIGGTVGEYQNLLFLEAARMLKLKHPKDVIFILVSYLPIPKMIGEMKTKPTQHAVRDLNSAGIQPDIIIARSKVPLDNLRKEKISIFCNVSEEDVISAPNIKSIYEIPINFEKDNLGKRILRKFGLKSKKNDLKDWKKLVRIIQNPKEEIKIGIVGKYFKTGNFTLIDSYISVIEAIKHACYSFGVSPQIIWLDAQEYERKPLTLRKLKKFNGIIVPGGFGGRGVEGKIKAIEYCRKNKIPFLGLCLGMQLAVVEFARNVCGMKKANSTEFSKNCQVPVIDIMPEQKKNLTQKKYGGTMRLGAYPCRLNPRSLSFKAYKTSLVSERHRHRYELNNEFRDILEKKGMLTAGINPQRNLVEIIEISSHPFFLGTQFHPEFKSRPLRPHPLFKAFIKTAIRAEHLSINLQR
ncbi:CTP synthase [bacterium (Candidatus Gribaldobacteria) CG_4_9_14_3_um_filter_36_15]|uniref:CTP synthase n=4 Tax=Candidatus Gribaldobacteria TaxID=2798536 RepID=A0A2M7VJE4_9BACT|nr:MAG: CTP synthase [Parcubacteria group bacterium CG2_30_36_21]PIR91264.1 MAG: CTP synthase [bacterium (Candidatus Gribaldobacteria) CG10_big_fil_rev_8_21_14_0_10_37_46]PIV14198.1 MAG: CTP synthase [bacterium (Candidatus Gribaldobacteria) CG03_land_8_20_14_0_80_36_40]PJA01962.1 MAG: CTP synthase [bacterium (Candidatus Gribaldobacteria) CG_4_10_14_0_2_um_filter_36_18]PJB09118.1 MAG: CTP synthase [bacterium (Candidatus Gribaldobacteria) CG_4_9_14_3_um_filter_36_15]